MNPKIEIIIHGAIIILLVLLISYIVESSNKLSCSECIITFESKRISFIEIDNIFSIPINISFYELYDELSDGKCKVVWDKSNGFMKQ